MLDNMKDKTFLLMCTVRYCLGRKSYAVGWVRDLLIRHWNEIPKNDRKTILEDIKKYMNSKELPTWERLIWDRIIKLGIKDGLILERKNGKYT